MTAINIVLKGDRAFVLTDGAGYSPDGVSLSTEQKIMPIVPLSMALAVRGSTALWPFLSAFINELHDSFDSVVEGFPETYRTCRDLQGGAMAGEFAKPHEIFIVGISEMRGAAEAYAFVNFQIPGVPVEEMVPLSEGLVIPADAPFLEGLSGCPYDPGRDDWDPATHGLQLIEAQRAIAWPLGLDGALTKGVGGFAQLTIVSRESVTSRILCRWPDKIGEKIGEAA